ncbi:MAG TPA: lysozyme inhibitor LprI family protein [Rhizomicrobium sp.]
MPLLLCTAPAVARDSCDNAMSQNEMSACAEDAFARTDKVLNKVYQDTMKGLDDHGRDLLKTSERAWVSFRDAECAYQNESNEGGSIYPMVYAGCQTTLTKDRIKQLQAGQN